jgi:hypothetical protein
MVAASNDVHNNAKQTTTGKVRPAGPVATDVGSIHEAVIHGQTGYLVPAGDAAQLRDRGLVPFVEQPLHTQHLQNPAQLEQLA